MNFKKTVALFMVFAMLLSFGLVVEADESVEIVSPANGSQIEYSESETELVITAEAGMILQIYLDGERLPDIEAIDEETRVSLGVLELGKHIVSVVAVSGSASFKAESIFTITHNVTKENYHDTFTGGSSASLAPYSSKPDLGVDENGDSIPAYYGSFPGIDGDEYGAIGFRYMKTATAINLPDGYELCYVMEPMPNGLSSKFALEYDLMLLNPGAWEIRAGVPTGGGNRYSQLAVSRFLDDNGFVAGTEIEYPVGEWMHIKHLVDVTAGKTDLYIDDELVIDDINVGTDNLTGISVLKFQYYATQPVGPQGFNLDNVRITSEAMYSGIEAVKYALADGTEKNIPDDSVITEATNKVIFSNDVEGFAPWDRGTIFSVFADGVEIPVKSIRRINNSSFSVELSEPLPEKAHVEVLTEYNSIPIKTFFDVNAIDFGIYGVSFRQGREDIHSTAQLSGGESLLCFLSVKTPYVDDKTVMVIFGIYSGNRLVSLQTKSGVTIYGNTTAIRQKTIPVNIPEDIEDISIEVFLIDELSTRRPLSYPFVLGK